jgi:hypothetical protein
MISVVCVFNDAEVLERRLLPRLGSQSSEHELVAVDNRGSRFSSAAQALNWGARRAHGNWLLFVHQDVELLSEDWLAHAERMMEHMPGPAGWFGVAGATADGRLVGILRDRAAVWGEAFAAPLEVQTLDECVLLRRRDEGREEYFDGSMPGWHAYGVEACCAAARAGATNYVLPLPVWHDSKATNLAGLEAAHAYVWAKHGGGRRRIHTTCGVLPESHGWQGSRWRDLPRRLGRRLAAARYQLAGHRRALRRELLATLEELTGTEELVECLHARAPFGPIEAAAMQPQSRHLRRVVHRFEGWEATPSGSAAVVVWTDLARSASRHLGQLDALGRSGRRHWLCIDLADARATGLWKELRRRAAAVALTRRDDQTPVAIFEFARG